MNRSTFLRMIADRLQCDEQRADALTAVVFEELRARLTPREAADVASQLPAALKTSWLEDEKPTREVRRTHRDEFIGRVRQRAVLANDEEAERAVRAVFSTLQYALGSAHGMEGEAGHIFAQLPKDLKALWLQASREPASTVRS